MIYEDISQTIGRTPVVRIKRLAPANVQIYVKIEAANRVIRSKRSSGGVSRSPRP